MQRQLKFSLQGIEELETACTHRCEAAAPVAGVADMPKVEGYRALRRLRS